MSSRGGDPESTGRTARPLAVLFFLTLGALPACTSKASVGKQQRALTGVSPSFEPIYAFRKPLRCATRLLADPDGSLYGLACGGGAHEKGAIFQRMPDGGLVTLHDFTGNDGAEPSGRLVRAGDGTLFGSTRSGGANGTGTLWKYASGVLTTLCHFTASDARYPSQLILGSDAALYGTTEEGGSSGYGTLFKWSAGTGLVILQSFDRATGGYPYAGVIEASDGALYGTCDSEGAKRHGTLWKWQAPAGLTVLHAFSGEDGGNPLRSGLVEGSDNAFYGTTSAGGAKGYGTLFKWDASTGLATLHSFDYDTEGGYVVGGLIQGSDGALYGTASAGGTGHRGTVFRWTTVSGLSVLHAFSDTADIDGALPHWGVTEGSGALFGTTESGGAGNGVLFQLGTSGSPFTILHRFGEAETVAPGGRIAVAADGSLYGTSREGGAYGQGTVFRVASGAATILHSFDWDRGATPESGLILGSDGAFYGTSGQGASGCGTLFRWLDGTGFSTLQVFDWSANGCYPAGGVIQASDGAYYGTASYGGANNGGTIFRWDGRFTKLHDFAPSTEGAGPSYNGLIQGSDGAFYGTTASSGPAGGGTLFRWDGTLTVLHPFSSTDGGGTSPAAGVIQGEDGALYGTTSGGGSSSLGTLFRWHSTGGLVTLHSFTGSDGKNPYLPLMQRPDRMIYGVADTDAAGYGRLFQWDPVAGLFDSALTFTPAMGSSLSAWLTNGSGDEAYGTTWEGGPAAGGSLYRLTFTAVDPCASNHGGCAVHATCSNNAGSSVCTCNPGYFGDGLTCTAVALVSIQVTPANRSIAKGTGLQLTATGSYNDGSTQDLTTQVSWASSASAVATVSNTAGAQGWATSVNPGVATMTATLGSISGATGLTVTPPVLVTVVVTPENPSLAKGLTTQLTATGTYSDGSQQNITRQVTWLSANSAVATVSNTTGSQGRATAVDLGTATISAAASGISGGTSVAVTAATMVTIAVTPAQATIARGTSIQYIATGNYSDSTVSDLTTQATWASANPSVATIGNTAGSQGRATGANVGTTTITATFGSVVGSTGLTVNNATLSMLDVIPVDPTLPRGNTLQLRVIGVYTDDTTQDLTETASWTSSATSIVAVSNTPGSKGLASASAMGTSTVTASHGALSDYMEVTVSPASLVAIAVAPVNPAVAKGTGVQFVATGTYTDGSTQPLTTQVTWSSSAPSVATISNVAGSQGRATGVNAGTSSITAVMGTVSGATTLAVSEAELASIAVTPTNPRIPRAIKTQLTATGTFTDGTTQDLTSSAVWTSSSTAVATVIAGLVTVLAAGNTTITATMGSVAGSTVLTGTTAALSSLAVTPSGTTTIHVGDTLQMTATGTFSDGTKLNLSSQVVWSSSSKRYVSVSTTGLVTGVRITRFIIFYFSVTVSAQLSGVSGSARIQVR